MPHEPKMGLSRHNFLSSALQIPICLSVNPFICLSNMTFSAPNQDKCLKLFVKIPTTNEHLFYNYFVLMSVSYRFATHGPTRSSSEHILHTMM